MRALLFLALLFAGCTGQAPAQPERPAGAQDLSATTAAASAIEQLADSFLRALLERHPEIGTRLSLPGARYDLLFDNSEAALARWQAREDDWLGRLRSLPKPPVGSRDWLTRGVLLEHLEAARGERICRKPLWEASTTTGWHTSLPFLFDTQPLDTAEERRWALARLAALERYIDTEVENLRRGLALGYSSPRVTVAAVPDQVRALLTAASPLRAMVARAKDPAFAASAGALLDERIEPAVTRYARFMQNEYLPTARESLAVIAHPDGMACYRAVIRSFSTVSPEPDRVHALGLAQVAAIRQEMQAVVAAEFPERTLAPFLRALGQDPDLTFPSEAAVLAYSRNALAAAKAAMPRAFHDLPRADVLIKPYPPFAASGVGEYHASSEDGSRPGIYYIAVRDPTTRPRATQLSTLYHETYPGHHLQGALSVELGDAVHPLARYLGNAGFSEGWALYAERVAQELGLYADGVDTMGLLSDQGARAARLVVDTGLHTRGWSRQQAVDYMLANTGWGETDIQNDVNRYISWPGQANSYMLGMLTIKDQRRRAQQQLRERFELRDFHREVLRYGELTLPMLEEAIGHWLNHQQEKGAWN
jgi:uncharacterized protein (DUF885 family)